MKTHVSLFATAIAILFAGTTSAAPGHFTAAVTGGTLGIGPEIGYRASDAVGFRGSATFLSISKGFDSDDIAYDGKVKLKSYGAMLDFYPGGGRFRLSAGARINRNRAEADATPTTNTEVGNAIYTPAQIGRLSGNGTVKKFAPAATLGWAGGNRSGFMFTSEVGALFQGRVRINRFTATGSAQSNVAFQADLERERLSLQDDVDKFKVYPILQFGIGWRF